MFSVALSQLGCLFVLQICCHSLNKKEPHWLPILLILLSNDIQLNPGPTLQNNLFNFMTWNVNSLGKDNFQRVQLLEAHNSIFNYDLISINETSLNDSVELPETLLDNYSFLPTILPILDMVGWDCSIRILFLSK